MKKVEIENREKDGGKRDYLMVDLVIDETKIDTGSNPISSHSFWKDMEDQTQRALYRIEKGNPTMSFKFDLSTMGMSDEQLEERFKAHIKEKYGHLDVDRIFEIIDGEMGEMKLTGPDDNHPNPFMKFPINGQLTKNVIICVIDKLMKDEGKGEK